MPSTTLTLHHRGPKLLTTSSPKDKRHNDVHFFRQRSLEPGLEIRGILVANATMFSHLLPGF